MHKNKILVATPTYEVHEEFLKGYLDSVKNQTIACDLLLVNTSDDESFSKRLASFNEKVILLEHYDKKEDKVINARRKIIDYFLRGNWDFLFFVDNDIFIESKTAEHLSSHQVDIISAIYLSPQRLGDKNFIIPIAYDFGPDEEHRRPLSTYEVLNGKHILKLHSVGFGCCMLSRKVCEDVSLRDFQGERSSEDIFFCIDARKKGFKVYLDTQVFANHHGWKIDNPKNKYLTKEYYSSDRK